MSAGDITDRAALDVLRSMRNTVTGSRSDAIDRAMTLIGGRLGSQNVGHTQTGFSRPELLELLALIRDEDGDADETVLDDVEHRLAAALHRLDKQQGELRT